MSQFGNNNDQVQKPASSRDWLEKFNSANHTDKKEVWITLGIHDADHTENIWGHHWSEYDNNETEVKNNLIYILHKIQKVKLFYYDAEK